LKILIITKKPVDVAVRVVKRMNIKTKVQSYKYYIINDVKNNQNHKMKNQVMHHP